MSGQKAYEKTRESLLEFAKIYNGANKSEAKILKSKFAKLRRANAKIAYSMLKNLENQFNMPEDNYGIDIYEASVTLLKIVDLMGTLNGDELFLLFNEMSVLSDESYKKDDGMGDIYAIASAIVYQGR